MPEEKSSLKTPVAHSGANDPLHMLAKLVSGTKAPRKNFVELAASLKNNFENAEVPPMGNGEAVLVVDDEAPIRDMSKISLEIFGYKVHLASEGMEAVSIASQNIGKIDVVLLDMMMPGLAGPATLHLLKKIDPLLRIIASSGYVSEDLVREMAGESICGFLSKPYTAQELVVVVQRVLLKA